MIVTLTNVTRPDSPVVARLKRLLEGQTYMNFEVLVCPAGGSFDVLAQTTYDAPRGRVRDFLLFILASQEN